MIAAGPIYTARFPLRFVQAKSFFVLFGKNNKNPIKKSVPPPSPKIEKQRRKAKELARVCPGKSYTTGRRPRKKNLLH